MNYVTFLPARCVGTAVPEPSWKAFLPARGVGTAVPEPSWKASAGLEAHAANSDVLTC